MTFDDALPALVCVCETSAGFLTLRAATVVRDLRGRLRLVLDPDPNAAPAPALDVEALERRLAGELGGYFAPPVWSTRAQRKDEARLARVILEQAAEWRDAGYDDPTGGHVTAAVPWKKVERRLSKLSWLDSAGHRPPWNLATTTPGVVTFYSFKGGVGRTTALVACAWQLARAGKKVVVIDLDLEAPGLNTVLDVKAQRGMVDLLVDHMATGEVDLDGAVVERCPALGTTEGDLVSVIPAGMLGPAYLEKLARLDFVSHNPAGSEDAGSPVEQALQAVLTTVRRKYDPHDILLDSRAGLHDLAGLSLHSLAHVDVLVGRATEQSHEGFNLTLGVLAKRKGMDRLQAVVVHTFAPVQGTREAQNEEQEFLHRSYQSFVKHVFTPQQALTITETDQGHHTPVVIRRHAELDRFVTLASIESILFAPDFTQLRERIGARCVSLGGAP